MTLAVGLIRGINVGQANLVSMADLALAFEAAGLRSVKTILRSGNVVFESAGEPLDSDAARVEKVVRQRTGVDARVLLLSRAKFEHIANANPLIDVADDFSRLVVTFLGEPPNALALTVPDAETIAPETVSIGTDAVYQWSPLGVSKSKLKPAFWKQFGPVATARNWRTVLRIADEFAARHAD